MGKRVHNMQEIEEYCVCVCGQSMCVWMDGWVWGSLAMEREEKSVEESAYYAGKRGILCVYVWTEYVCVCVDGWVGVGVAGNRERAEEWGRECILCTKKRNTVCMCVDRICVCVCLCVCVGGGLAMEREEKSGEESA